MHLPALPCNPLAELTAWLGRARAGLRLARSYPALARVGVAQAIAADALAFTGAVSAHAHADECHDREALAVLDALTAAHRGLDATERRALARVRALVLRSADLAAGIAHAAAPAAGSFSSHD